jgi:hypothetical protein
LVGKPEGKRLLGRSRDDNIRIDLGETGWEDVDWMHLALNYVVTWPSMHQLTGVASCCLETSGWLFNY